MDFCKYKNILGEPKKGVHSIRIFNIAIVDVIATFLVAWLFSWFFNLGVIGTIIITLILIIVSIPIHKLFCVDTTLNRLV